MEDKNWRFSDSYREELALPSGLRATLRLVQASDKAALLEGFEHVGARSRYLRFFTGKPELTADELRYYSEVDGVNHFAMGAIVHDGSDGDHPAATARFVRVRGTSSADFALTVVDEYQNLGLGSVLLSRLMSAAKERGIEALSGEILAENSTMLDLVRRVAPAAELEPDGPMVHCTIPLA